MEYDKIAKEDAIVILADSNAQIKKEKYLRHIPGKQTIHEKTNNNGLRLLNLARRTDIVISSTMSRHPAWHKDDCQVLTKHKKETRLKWINTNKEGRNARSQKNNATESRMVGTCVGVRRKTAIYNILERQHGRKKKTRASQNYLAAGGGRAGIGRWQKKTRDRKKWRDI
ncbi:hypothetical protein Trydic_g8793 [Trypoxylus dichotomus]